MTQRPGPRPKSPPIVHFPPGTAVRLEGFDQVGTVVHSDDWWDTLQQRGVAADQQVLVEWTNGIVVRTWERIVHLEIVGGQTGEMPQVNP